MWLEINNKVIIGVHSDRCDNDCEWVEYEGDASPGDRWNGKKVISADNALDPMEEKRIAARARITEFYPEWKQLNILRENDTKALQTMGTFIDACRAWSNNPKSRSARLLKIKP